MNHLANSVADGADVADFADAFNLVDDSIAAAAVAVVLIFV